MKLFEYALLYHPRTTKDERDAGKKSKSVLLNGGVMHLVAEDEKQVAIIAAREIPEDYLDRLDCVEIAIRPF